MLPAGALGLLLDAVVSCVISTRRRPIGFCLGHVRNGFFRLGRRVGFGRLRPASVVSLVFLFCAAFGVGFGRLFPPLRWFR